MIKIIVDIEVYNKKATAIELEHISQLIVDGWEEGQGWSIKGIEEKEPIIPEDETLLVNENINDEVDY